MKPYITRATIKPQALTTPPFTNDTTLVDDTVALVDDTTALVGGPTTTHPGLRAGIKLPRYYPIIKKRR